MKIISPKETKVKPMSSFYLNNIKNKEKIKEISFKGEPYRGIKDKQSRMRMAHLTIHSAASMAAAISFSHAQAPGSDELLLSGVTTSMVGSLLKGCYGIPAFTTLCTSAAACAIGFRLGTGWWRHTISWIPGLGNGVSAATTFTLHEATGWTIVALCEKLLANGALDSSRKITIKDLEKMRDGAEKLKAEQKKTNNNNLSFKGDCMVLQKNVISLFKEKINKEEVKEIENKETDDLVNIICNIYKIDKNSKTQKGINNFFKKLNNHLNRNINAEHPPVLLTDEQLIDNSLELHYWLLIALLNNAQKEKKDINNLRINDISFQDKNIQKQAVVYMNKNN